MELKIFAGSAGTVLANKMCQELNIPLGQVYLHTFPSGEHYCQYRENIRGCDLFIVQPICNPAHERMMELLVMVDAAKRASAGRITVVTPYLGYLRQDRKTKSRTPITARLMADLLTAAGVQRVVGMDFHCEQAQGFFNIPVDHLYAAPIFVKYITDPKRVSKEDLVIGELLDDLKERYPTAYFYSRRLFDHVQLVISDQQFSPIGLNTSNNIIVSVGFGLDDITVEYIRNRHGSSGPETSKKYSVTPLCNHRGIPAAAVVDICSRLDEYFNQPKPVIVSPDAGGIKRGAALAEVLKTDFAFISKKRVSDTDVKSYGLVGEVSGRDVIVVDDMTESCGTILEAARVLKTYGAKSVRAIITHALLNKTGYERLEQDNNLDELIITDSCNPTPHKKLRILSVASLLATAIEHINNNKSITELFEIKGF